MIEITQTLNGFFPAKETIKQLNFINIAYKHSTGEKDERHSKTNP